MIYVPAASLAALNVPPVSVARPLRMPCPAGHKSAAWAWRYVLAGGGTDYTSIACRWCDRKHAKAMNTPV